MKNVDLWHETKWTMTDGTMVPKSVHPMSLHTATLQAAAYHRIFEQYASGPIADFGCGEVPMYMLYREVDPNPYCVDWDGGKHDIKHADLCCDLNNGLDIVDVEALSIASPAIDYNFGTVCAWDLIEHLWRPRYVFNDAADLLAPGGHLLLSAPFMYWIHEMPHDYHRYTEYALRKYCELVGLEVVECEPYGTLRDVLTDIGAKVGVGYLGRPTARLHRFPLGYTLVARKP